MSWRRSAARYRANYKTLVSGLLAAIRDALVEMEIVLLQ